MATGAPGTNGVWQYGEDDSETTFSALLNKAASTTDTQLGLDRARLTTLEAKPTAGLIPIAPTSVDKASGTATANTLGLVTFSSITSLSLNGVFTTNYEKYRIFIKLAGQSGAGILQMRLRNAGVDFSGSNYSFGGYFGRTTGAGSFNGGNNNSAAFLTDYVAMTDWTLVTILDMVDPKATDQTTWINSSWNYDSVGPYGSSRTGMLYNSLSYDGFSIFPSGAGALSGTVQVFAYND